MRRWEKRVPCWRAISKCAHSRHTKALCASHPPPATASSENGGLRRGAGAAYRVSRRKNQVSVKQVHAQNADPCCDRYRIDSCWLKIARVVRHRLEVLHEDREVTRLGASVFESGLISPEAMSARCALSNGSTALCIRLARIGCGLSPRRRCAMRATPAPSCRVKSESGWHVEFISGLEEGRLIHRGVMLEPRTLAAACWSISAVVAARSRSRSIDGSVDRLACPSARYG